MGRKEEFAENMLGAASERSDRRGLGEPSPRIDLSPRKKLTGSVSFFRGDGRSRTAVQTKSQVAFYTLILPLIVGRGLPEDGPPGAYPLGT